MPLIPTQEPPYYEINTTPAPPGTTTWIGLLSQGGTDAPIPEMLTNTLSGTITWARDAQGAYSGTLTGEFTDPDKIIILAGNGTNRCILTNGVIDTNTIFIETADAAGVYQDDLLQRTSIMLIKYP